MRGLWLSIICLGFALTARAEDGASGSVTATAQGSAVPSPLNMQLSYEIETDLADELEPRIYEHQFSLTGKYDLGRGFSVLGKADFFYQSLGRSVVVEDSDDSMYWDFEAAVAKQWELGRALGGKHTGKVALRNIFPVSESNRYEGIRAIPGASAALVSDYFDSAVSVVNSVTYRYTVHTYLYSPVSGKLNSKDSLAYLLSGTVNIIGGLSATVGTGVKFARKHDDSVDYAYNNFQTLAYSFGDLSLSLTHENGGFTREGNISLWYIDRYRRLVSGAVSYAF